MEHRACARDFADAMHAERSGYAGRHVLSCGLISAGKSTYAETAAGRSKDLCAGSVRGIAVWENELQRSGEGMSGTDVKTLCGSCAWSSFMGNDCAAGTGEKLPGVDAGCVFGRRSDVLAYG